MKLNVPGKGESKKKGSLGAISFSSIDLFLLIGDGNLGGRRFARSLRHGLLLLISSEEREEIRGLELGAGVLMFYIYILALGSFYAGMLVSMGSFRGYVLFSGVFLFVYLSYTL